MIVLLRFGLRSFTIKYKVSLLLLTRKTYYMRRSKSRTIALISYLSDFMPYLFKYCPIEKSKKHDSNRKYHSIDFLDRIYNQI